MQVIIPAPVINIGNIKQSTLNSPPYVKDNEVPETTKAAQVDSAKDPNKSDPIPATSPTLSPTLSAIVAGFLGSSSGKSY